MPINPNNYCTREAAERLQKAGIGMETEIVWYQSVADDRWYLILSEYIREGKVKAIIPAPSLAEVWRELPKNPQDMLDILRQYSGRDGLLFLFGLLVKISHNIDAAIDLKIWLEGRRK